MYELILLALAVWREARNQPRIAQEGVAWTIKNRAASGGWWGKTIIQVILMPEQYSSFNKGDPNSTKFPGGDDSAFDQCLDVAQNVIAGTVDDPTAGCQNYFDASLDSHPPTWATDGSFTHVTDLAELRFWRRV